LKKTKSFRTKERQRAEGACLQSLCEPTDTREHEQTNTWTHAACDRQHSYSACTTWRREGDGGGFSQSACRPERRVRSEEEFGRESSLSVGQFIIDRQTAECLVAETLTRLPQLLGSCHDLRGVRGCLRSSSEPLQPPTCAHVSNPCGPHSRLLAAICSRPARGSA
jgi:hypothetical protein